MHYPDGAEALFKRLTGARILQIGSPDDGDLEGGGLVIDYVPEGATDRHRVVLAFNELGMWVVHEGTAPEPPTPVSFRG